MHSLMCTFMCTISGSTIPIHHQTLYIRPFTSIKLFLTHSFLIPTFIIPTFYVLYLSVVPRSSSTIKRTLFSSVEAVQRTWDILEDEGNREAVEGALEAFVPFPALNAIYARGLGEKTLPSNQ